MQYQRFRTSHFNSAEIVLTSFCCLLMFLLIMTENYQHKMVEIYELDKVNKFFISFLLKLTSESIYVGFLLCWKLTSQMSFHLLTVYLHFYKRLKWIELDFVSSFMSCILDGWKEKHFIEVERIKLPIIYSVSCKLLTRYANKRFR